MPHKKIMIGGTLYTVMDEYARKGDAVVRANMAEKTGLFKTVKVTENGGKWLLCVHGVARDPTKVTAETLLKEIGEKPGKVEYDRRTGRRK
jgi:hypothetical protein